MMELQYIHLDVADYIATVVMDRPPVNAQNAAFRTELTWVFDAISDREDARVAILTGTKGRYKCCAPQIIGKRPQPSTLRSPKRTSQVP